MQRLSFFLLSVAVKVRADIVVPIDDLAANLRAMVAIPGPAEAKRREKIVATVEEHVGSVDSGIEWAFMETDHADFARYFPKHAGADALSLPGVR